VVTLTSVLWQIMKFPLTCFTVHSVYYSQITHITAIQITAVNIHCNISSFVPGLVVSSWHLHVEQKYIFVWDVPL